MQQESLKFKNKISFYSQKYLWICNDIIIPFIFTRVILVGVALLVKHFPYNPSSESRELSERGWGIVQNKFLQLWARWDSYWYLNIIHNGYVPSSSISHIQSNVGFYPLYPYLIKFCSLLLPVSCRNDTGYLIIGCFFSNLFFLIGLILFYNLVRNIFSDDTFVAQRSVWYILLFPTSFYFSCFYTESTFFMLSLLVFYFAQRKAWLAASIIGAFLPLTRAPGILIVIPLLWIYCEANNWKFRAIIRTSILSFALIPLSLFLFLLYMRQITGSLTAPFQSQLAWGRVFAMPWQSILHGGVGHLEPICAICFVALSFAAFWIIRDKSYSIYALLLMLLPLFTGTPYSIIRFSMVVFPVFMVLAVLGKKQIYDKLIMVGFMSLQVFLFISWRLSYWVQ